MLDKPFATVTYTDAVALLHASGKKFDHPVAWGLDLQSEHERYLTEARAAPRADLNPLLNIFLNVYEWFWRLLEPRA